MKALLLLLSLLTSTHALALDLNESAIASLYENGKTEEKEFKALKLSSAESKKLLLKLEAAALRLARVWPDTILEGPYSQLEDAKLDVDSINAIIYKNEIIGFSASVRAAAALNDSCEYDYNVSEEEAERSFRECLEDYKGTIYQSFIADKKGELIEEYFEPADFSD